MSEQPDIKKDRYGVYIYYHGRLMSVDISDGTDSIFMLYHLDEDQWAWSVRHYRHDENCTVETISDPEWIELNVLPLTFPCRPMREATWLKIVKKYRDLSIWSNVVFEILLDEICKSYGQMYLWFYAADRFDNIERVLSECAWFNEHDCGKEIDKFLETTDPEIMKRYKK